jgi:hypothetical protein
MSAVRVYVDGRPEWRKADDGYAPHRSHMGVVYGHLAVAAHPIPLVKTEAQRRAEAEKGREYYRNHKEHALAMQRLRRNRFRSKAIAAPPINERGRAVVEVPRCGALMRMIDEPCHRLPGHADSHRSRAVMERDSERRRRP